MALTANDIIESGKWDLQAKEGNPYEDPELLDYLNRSLVALDSYLLSKKSDWLKKADAVEALSSGQRKITMPTRCIGVDSIWRSGTVSASTDMTFTNSTKIILSAATDYVDAGFAAGNKIGIGGSTYNDSDLIGLLTIASIDDDGAGTNNEITVNESTLVDDGAGSGSGTIIKVENNEIHKATNENIHRLRKWRGSGTPANWAWEGTDIIFDYFASQAYGLIIHFSQKSNPLIANSPMPYNNEFDDQLRQGMIIIAEHKLDESSGYSLLLEQMFRESSATKVLNRNYVRRRRRLRF